MKTYKVIKSFGSAKKGDIFTQKYDMNHNGTKTYEMCRTDEHKDGESITQILITMSQDIIDEFVEKGFMIEVKSEESNNYEQKVNDIAEYVDELIDTYENSYQDMIESFHNGDVQPCVKVEAETVYYNMIKVLNSIKNKINE